MAAKDFTICNMMDGTWLVHRAGCRDLKKAKMENGRSNIQAESAEQAVEMYLERMNADFIAEGSQGYDESWFRILNCAKRT
jgi:hypothetical protein